MLQRFTARSRVRRATRDNRAYTFENPEAVQAAWRKFKQSGDERVRNQLIEHYLYLARCIAERIGAKLPDEVEVDDLMSAGIFGLMDAIDAFDLERGVKFETYCAPRVRGAIFDELRTMDWVPRLVRHRAHQLENATRALEIELGRNPTDDELAGHMGISRPNFDKLRRDANAVSLVSLSRKFSDEESSRDTFEIDVLPDDRGCDPVHETQRKDLKDLITRGLNRDEKLIVVLYYYEQMTMKEIGLTLDLSESRVSQMHSAILERLRDKLQMRIPEFDSAEE
ncbi:MAG: FliA/WhiG family RNA polymerase sigma factor [Phycisphaerales bacterium]|nr:FliA/WhiG family RNA polymerase sigma factor [Phycisphaerales bacterium]